jgi:uncharacterized protein YndB with AHSA1/START domain
MAARSEPRNPTTMDLAGDREIIITRTFNGPPRVVFEVWTNAEHVRRWWAPKSHGVAIVDATADVRPGGAYRYVFRQGDKEFAFSGVYTDVTRPSRLVYTQVFEPMAEAGAVIITITFEERDGKTHLRAHELYPSAEARAAALATGMEHGMRETMDQLDELVVSLR